MISIIRFILCSTFSTPQSSRQLRCLCLLLLLLHTTTTTINTLTIILLIYLHPFHWIIRCLCFSIFSLFQLIIPIELIYLLISLCHLTFSVSSSYSNRCWESTLDLFILCCSCWYHLSDSLECDELSWCECSFEWSWHIDYPADFSHIFHRDRSRTKSHS